MARVLLLVDVQNEYFPGGGLELPAMKEASKNIAVLLNHFRDIGAPVLHLQHMSMSAEPGLFEPYSQGWELHEATAPRPGEATIPKYYPNGFRQTWLLAALQQRCASELVVAGAMTQACIDSTVRGATDYGFRCSVAADACAARALEFDGRSVSAADVQSAFLAALREYVTVASTAELIANGDDWRDA
jgi:nicotinamidase-related amidase